MSILSTLCLKKVLVIKLFATLSNINQFSRFCTAGKRMKFATKTILNDPSHIRNAATLPWEIIITWPQENKRRRQTNRSKVRKTWPRNEDCETKYTGCPMDHTWLNGGRGDINLIIVSISFIRQREVELASINKYHQLSDDLITTSSALSLAIPQSITIIMRYL